MQPLVRSLCTGLQVDFPLGYNPSTNSKDPANGKRLLLPVIIPIQISNPTSDIAVSLNINCIAEFHHEPDVIKGYTESNIKSVSLPNSDWARIAHFDLHLPHTFFMQLLGVNHSDVMYSPPRIKVTIQYKNCLGALFETHQEFVLISKSEENRPAFKDFINNLGKGPFRSSDFNIQRFKTYPHGAWNNESFVLYEDSQQFTYKVKDFGLQGTIIE